jgi:hypothetical protein
MLQAIHCGPTIVNEIIPEAVVLSEFTLEKLHTNDFVLVRKIL